MVEDDERRPEGGNRCSKLGYLAAARKRGRVGALAPPLYQAYDLEPAADRELLQLGHTGGLIGLTEVEIDQQRAVPELRAFKHVTLDGDARPRNKAPFPATPSHQGFGSQYRRRTWAGGPGRERGELNRRKNDVGAVSRLRAD